MCAEMCYWLMTGPACDQIVSASMTCVYDRRVLQAVQHLRSRFAEQIRVEELASAAGMSAATFHRQSKICDLDVSVVIPEGAAHEWRRSIDGRGWMRRLCVGSVLHQKWLEADKAAHGRAQDRESGWLPGSMSQDQQAKIAIVTGVSRGIGRSTVESRARRGVNVIFTYHSHHEDSDALVVRATSFDV